jgi:hypothetical protein
VKLPRVVLTADLSEGPAPWRLVLSVPFGPGKDELGLVTDIHRTPVPYVPASFGVAGDGSVWILDSVNKRLARYSSGGVLLDEIPGFKFDRFSPHPADVVISAGRILVLEEGLHLHSLVTSVSADRRLRSTEVTDGVNPLNVAFVFPLRDGLGAVVNGYAALDSLGEGPSGFHEIDPETGHTHPIPGIPLESGNWATVEYHPDQDLSVAFVNGDASAIQPVHIKVVSRPGASPIPAVISFRTPVGVSGQVGMFVKLTPSRKSDAQRYGGGTWYLQLGPDHTPLVWERLPERGIQDTEQHRHIAVGPDGGVYLMVPTPTEERIYRR